MTRILSFLILSASAFAGTWMASPGKGSHEAAGGAGNEQFGDDFVRTNSTNIGAAWTEASGSWAIASNQLEANAGSFAMNKAIYTGTATDTVNQYVKVQIITANGYPHVVFRYTNSSSPMYQVNMGQDSNSVSFNTAASASDTSYVTTQSTSVTIDPGQVWGWTCDGTGTSVVVRGWLNPTGNVPTSASNWGGDTTPDVTFTDDPASPVNTGNYVGVGAEMNTTYAFAAFFGGDIP